MTQQVLADLDTAPIDAKLRATLHLLRKMTLQHTALAPDDVRAVLATGVTRQAVADALHVAYLFNIYDRLADTMGWHVPDEDSGFYQTAAQMLLKRGYG